MKIKLEKDQLTKTIRFYGEISDSDIITIDFNELDKRILSECSSSNDPSDWLLALELIFRRSRQSQSITPAS